MYVGRFVAVGRNAAGQNAVLYRVSSRSFPNRQAVVRGNAVVIVPRAGAEADALANPYVAYTALRLAGGFAIAGNGSHTDPISEKMAAGMAPRDALALSLLALDYEKDSYGTPRIAAVVPLSGERAWLGTVRRDLLTVREVTLVAGRAQYLATYEADDIRESQVSAFDAATAAEAARYAVHGGAFAALEKPVTSAAALAAGGAFQLGTYVAG